MNCSFSGPTISDGPEGAFSARILGMGGLGYRFPAEVLNQNVSCARLDHWTLGDFWFLIGDSMGEMRVCMSRTCMCANFSAAICWARESDPPRFRAM